MTRRRFTPREYEAMTDAWLNNQTYDAVAQAVTCQREVAKRMVEEGDDTYPPIRERTAQLINRAVGAVDNQRLKELELARRLTTKMLQDNAGAFRKMRLEPRGTQNADGTTTVHEATYSRMVTTMQKVMDMHTRLNGGGQQMHMPFAQSNVQVNVSNNASVEVQESAMQPADRLRVFLKKHAHAYATYNGTAEEGRLVAALVQEARRRAGDT